MKRVAWIIYLGAAVAMPAAAADGNIERGAQLHQQNCLGCHGAGIYTRANRIIHSYGDLVNRVRFCETQNELTWDRQQIEDVAAYLNANFYKFEK